MAAAQLFLKLNYYQNCYTCDETISLLYSMIHIHRLIQKETARFVETLIRRHLTDTGPVQKVRGVMVVWGGYFCKMKRVASYIINAPCSTVRSYRSQILVKNVCNTWIIKCNYFRFPFKLHCKFPLKAMFLTYIYFAFKLPLVLTTFQFDWC